MRMALILELGPAYGRTYKTVKEVKADFDAGQDFRILTMGPQSGRYASKANLKAVGSTSAIIHFTLRDRNLFTVVKF